MNPDPSTVLPQGADRTLGSNNPTLNTVAGVNPVANQLIQPNSPLTVPTTPIIPQDLAAQANVDQQSLLNQQTLDEQNAQNAVNTQESTYNASVSKGQSLEDMLLGRAADTATLEDQQGLPTINSDLRNLQTLQKTQTAEYIQGLKNIEAGNIRSISNNQGVALNRQRAIDSLLTSSLISAKQNDQLNAQAQVDRALSLKYDPIEQRIKSNDKFIENVYNSLSRADKKLADAKLAKNETLSAQIAEQKAKEKAIGDMIVQAAPVAPADVLARAREVQKNGGSLTDVALALGEYGGDYYQTALLKEQIKTQKATQAKIYNEIQAADTLQSKAEADSWVANISSGKAKLSDVPAKLKNQVSVGLSQATISSPEVKAKLEASQSVYNLAQELKTLEGKGGAVGFGLKKTVFSKIPGIDEDAISGTDRADYEAKFKQLKDTLASANLDKLKGAMSDKDIEFLRNIGTSLSLNMPETAFDTELEKVSATMAQIPGVVPIQVPVASNKFNKALGQPDTPILGTAIVNDVKDDGSIDFKLP